ncbi:Arginase/deacetylase [Nadsonia fulvescens var. elongata DSM 6958]|uniref:Histone deacetylase n=1 Tax=Nadsonia fulvescens var. elongata DSM 6958 TaxID=857566 RepID=A0A1E3PFW4_9ASCO|nr:Arginase/deacetylase [Nadsonia fulvescens var. elongata DSM 6958]
MLQPGYVGLVTGSHIAKIVDKLPSNRQRASMVDSLLQAYKLDLACEPIPVKLITRTQLLEYHDFEFIEFLLQEYLTQDQTYKDSGLVKLPKQPVLKKQAFGLEYDCPLFAQLDEYIRTIAGATVSCAQYLIEKSQAPGVSQTQSPIVINWHGGRHHAKKSKSAGFCYVNDVVLGILELRKTFDKVMYIDLDLHHGDGVATAFTYSNKVLCLSIHRYDIGFFPGTGKVTDCGMGRGKNYTVNIPLQQGLDDNALKEIFTKVIQPYYDAFKPDAIVVLCGCDGLTRDPHREWNLSMRGLGDSIDKILNWNKPTMLLGGGGYNHRDTARCWSFLTAKALRWKTMDDWDLLPEHEYLDNYKDDGYTFWVDEMVGNMSNANTPEYLKRTISPLQDRLKEIKSK